MVPHAGAVFEDWSDYRLCYLVLWPQSWINSTTTTATTTTSYTAWWQMHIGVNNLPKVGMRLLPWIGFESSPCWSQVQLSTHCATAPPYESWKQFILGSKGRVRVTRHKKHCWCGFLHSCECWLLPVLELHPSESLHSRHDMNVLKY